MSVYDQLVAVQRSGTVSTLRAVADLIEAGIIDDAVVVAVPKEGSDTYAAFIPPTRNGELLALLDEARSWVVCASERAA